MFIVLWLMVLVAICFGVYFMVQAMACGNSGGTFVQPVYGFPKCLGGTE